MAADINLHDLTDEDVALVRGLIQLLRRRHATASASDDGRERDWGHLPAATFAEDWNNDQDAAYDNWRERYGVLRSNRECGIPWVSETIP